MYCNNAGDESAWNQKSLLCVYEIPKEVEYITAPPRMKLYIDYSAEIYAVYLEYIAKEDIHVYSIDEAFLDVTEYLKKIIYDDTTHGTVIVGMFLLNTFQTLNIIRSIMILFFRQIYEILLKI